jgi:type II secretory pathway pseudopilin PulG
MRPDVTRAFTLLELIIAMFIVMLLLGLALAATREIFSHEELRQTERQIALFAKTARRYALRENRSYELVLDERWLELRPAEKIVDADDGEPLRFEIPQSVKLWVQRWGADGWESPRELAWMFMPDGLCAPNWIRLRQGEAWMEERFNPLTANRQDETWYLP